MSPRAPRTPEERARHNASERARMARETPEHRKARLAREREYDRERYARSTPEEREALRQRARERKHQRRAAQLLPLPPVGDRARLRIGAKMTLDQLAERTGIGRSTIGRLERGEEPRIGIARHNAYAAALAELQNVSPIIDRAVTQLEHTWEAVLATHNGYGWTTEQQVRLRRLVKNVQMSLYKVKERDEDDDTADVRDGASGQDRPGPEGEPGTQHLMGGADRE